MILGKFFCNCVFDEIDFNSEQLREIKQGLILGIDVTYALPTLSAEEMRIIREKHIKTCKIKFNLQ